MLLPNKLYSYNESVLSKLPIVLKTLEEEDYGVSDLYWATKRYFSSVNEYIDALDCLYALNRIELDNNNGVLRYVV